MSIQTLAQYQDAVMATLRAELPEPIALKLYPRYEKKLPAPSVLLSIEALGRDTDPATGQFARMIRGEARCLVDPTLTGADTAVRELALVVGGIINQQVWGLPLTSTATVGDIDQDAMIPELDGFLVWCVPWSQHVHFGEPAEWGTVALAAAATGATPAQRLIMDYPLIFRPEGSVPLTPPEDGGEPGSALEQVLGVEPATGPHRADRYRLFGDDAPQLLVDGGPRPDQLPGAPVLDAHGEGEDVDGGGVFDGELP